MGEGGCDPTYFLEKMTVSEAVAYIKGLNRRHRQSWEQTRFLCRLVAMIASGEELDMPFPWDEEEEEETAEEADARWKELAEKARYMEQLMKEKNEDKSDKMGSTVHDCT